MGVRLKLEVQDQGDGRILDVAGQGGGGGGGGKNFGGGGTGGGGSEGS